MNHNIGSSTVVMAGFDQDRPNVVKTLNLGDSGYLIFRPNLKKKRTLQRIFKSEAQQYRFNFPYQCGTAGDQQPDGKDYGQAAFTTEHTVQDYDIIVMATDGVFDNLYDHDITNCVKQNMIDKYSSKKEKVDLGLI